jgi:hypothetical protein
MLCSVLYCVLLFYFKLNFPYFISTCEILALCKMRQIWDLKNCILFVLQDSNAEALNTLASAVGGFFTGKLQPLQVKWEAFSLVSFSPC